MIAVASEEERPERLLLAAALASSSAFILSATSASAAISPLPSLFMRDGPFACPRILATSFSSGRCTGGRESAASAVDTDAVAVSLPFCRGKRKGRSAAGPTGGAGCLAYASM
jgi:hypothetical protein